MYANIFSVEFSTSCLWNVAECTTKKKHLSRKRFAIWDCFYFKLKWSTFDVEEITLKDIFNLCQQKRANNIPIKCLGSVRGPVGWYVAYNIRDPWFESSSWQFYLLSTELKKLYLIDEKKGRELLPTSEISGSNPVLGNFVY